MKSFLFLICVFFFCRSYSQQISIKEWDEQAQSNIRLLPKYGYQPKNESQLNADREFIKVSMLKDSSKRIASDHLITLGFNYLYRDIKTAMYRFNQAFLLDSTNSDIYWGFGAVYFTLGDYKRAAEQLRQGLSLSPQNTHLLTDYGTYFMAQYYSLASLSNEEALRNLDSAVTYLNKSYQIDSKNPNTLFKLSVCHFIKSDCKEAWRFYNECKAVGGQPITDDYTNDLKKNCPGGKIN